MKWREKQLPHYFGRLVHALDLVKFSQNEGTLLECQVPNKPKFENRLASSGF